MMSTIGGLIGNLFFMGTQSVNPQGNLKLNMWWLKAYRKSLDYRKKMQTVMI